PPMRIAVTGATGFIGRILCEQLVAEHDVRPVERARIGDLARFRDWSRVLGGMDAIVHLAAYAHGRGDASSLHAVNVDATRAAAAAAGAVGAPSLFGSSRRVHGEEPPAPLREASPIAPRDLYARSKARAGAARGGTAALRLRVLPPPLVYGAGVKANFLALMR